MYLKFEYEDGSEAVLPIAAGQTIQVFDPATVGVVAAAATTGLVYIAVEEGVVRTDESGTWVLGDEAEPAEGPDAEGPVVTGPDEQADRDELLAIAAELELEVDENEGDDSLRTKIAEARRKEQYRQELLVKAEELGLDVGQGATAEELETTIADAQK